MALGNRRLQALRFKSNFRPEKWDSAAHDHDEMVKALEARDGKRLAAVLRQHLLDKRDAVLNVPVPPATNEAPAGKTNNQ